MSISWYILGGGGISVAVVLNFSCIFRSNFHDILIFVFSLQFAEKHFFFLFSRFI